MTTRQRWIVAVLVLAVPFVAGVVVATRNGGDDEPGDGGTAADGSGGRPSVLPLRGTEGDLPDRPALGVKIDATERGRPQTGLGEADVVFEELVEGGLTRLLAVYHSHDPETVGPVRSARSTDIALLDELGRPLFAWSGANPTFAHAVRTAEVTDVGYGAAPDAYRHDDDRRAPLDLYASVDELRAAGNSAAEPPPALFEYRAVEREPAAETPADRTPAGETAAAETPAAGTPAAQGDAGENITSWHSTDAGGLTTSIRWTWDAPTGTWQRSQDGTPHVDEEDERITAANVVVRETPYRDSGQRDSTGAVVPEAVTVGEGDGLLLSKGRARPARWHKPSAAEPTAWAAANGSPLLLAPGRTWVEVLPPGNGTTG